MKIYTSWIDYRVLNKVLKTLNCIISLLRASGNLWKQKQIWQNEIYSDYTIKNTSTPTSFLYVCSSIRKHCRLAWGVMLWLIIRSEKKHISCFPTNENLWIKIIREAWFQCQIMDPNNITNMKFNYYTNYMMTW